jgi:hypothetical protein
MVATAVSVGEERAGMPVGTTPQMHVCADCVGHNCTRLTEGPYVTAMYSRAMTHDAVADASSRYMQRRQRAPGLDSHSMSAERDGATSLLRPAYRLGT